jgi:RimJ/RimL family protein N-acetyltransferase
MYFIRDIAMSLDVIENYGVRLKRLTEDKIELVRQWRNDPRVSQYMEYREIITPEMQKKWFSKIDNELNYYFIVEVDGVEIGLINIRDVDYSKGEGEPGFFIWDERYLNSDYSFRAELCILDFAFDLLNLKRLVAHVLKDNIRAIKFNKVFGFNLSQNQDSVYNQEYTLEFDNYRKHKEKIVKYLF